MMHHLLFSVDHVRCALPLARVRIVIQMVQLAPVPETRPWLAGTINLHGQIIPVWSVRSLFGIPERAPRLTDKLIIAEAGPGPVAFWVDETHIIQQSPVLPAPAENTGIEQPLAPGLELAADGTVIFSDPTQFPGAGDTPIPEAAHHKINPRRGEAP
jgi:purine-binding chemotaxis protein CheW